MEKVVLRVQENNVLGLCQEHRMMKSWVGGQT